MAKMPLLTDYVTIIIDLFEQFRQERIAQGEVKRGRPFSYDRKSFIIFFMLMQFSADRLLPESVALAAQTS